MTDTPDRAFGSRLRRHRRKRSLTQQSLGAPRYTGAHISALESGARRASAEAKSYLAGKLEIGLDELDETASPEVVDALEGKLTEARSSISTGRLGHAEEVLTHALGSAERFKVARVASVCWTGLARIEARKGRVEFALGHVDRAVEVVADQPPTLWVVPECMKVQLIRLEGDTPAATHRLERLKTSLLQNDLAVPRALARIYGLLAVVYMEAGRDMNALKAVADARALDVQRVDRETLGCMYLNLSGPLSELGESTEATRCLRQAEHLFRELGLPEEVAAARHNMGSLLSAEGDWKGARQAWARSRAAFREGRSGRNEVIALVNLARAEEALGDTAAARMTLQTALIKARMFAPRYKAVAEAHEALARLGSDDDLDQSLRHLQEAISIYANEENLTSVARLLRTKGGLFEAHNRAEEAMTCYRQALMILLESRP